jgi:Cu/Ag efflux protein CusF
MIAGTMAKARKSKKDIGDIVGGVAKAVGKAAAQNPLVAQNVKYVKAVQAGPTAVAKTAAMDLAAGAVGAAASRALSGVRVVRGVSAAAKKEQQNLARLEKFYSAKDLKKVQGLKQGDVGEYRFQRAQGAYDDGVSPKLDIQMQRQAVSDLMRSTKGPLKVVKKARGGGKNKR